MHDDVIDGLNWLIARGVADPDRVAIYGCSNGGCSALSNYQQRMMMAKVSAMMPRSCEEADKDQR